MNNGSSSIRRGRRLAWSRIPALGLSNFMLYCSVILVSPIGSLRVCLMIFHIYISLVVLGLLVLVLRNVDIVCTIPLRSFVLPSFIFTFLTFLVFHFYLPDSWFFINFTSNVGECNEPKNLCWMSRKAKAERGLVRRKKSEGSWVLWFLWAFMKGVCGNLMISSPNAERSGETINFYNFTS